MFSSHVKGSPLEGTAAVPPSSASREKAATKAERKAAEQAEERAAKALREATRQADKAAKAAAKTAAKDARKGKGAAVAARATEAPAAAAPGVLAPGGGGAAAPQPPAGGKPGKPAKEKARKAKPAKPAKPAKAAKPAAPGAGKRRGITIKLARHPVESRPKAPLQPSVILKPKPSRRQMAAAAAADPYAPKPKTGMDLPLVSLVVGVVAFALAWIPIVKYVGVAFAALGLLLAAIDVRNSAAEGWLPGVVTRWARTISVAAIVVVIASTMMAFKHHADDAKKASGNATSRVLSDDLGTKWTDFTETVDSIGIKHRGLELTLKNKSGGVASFDILFVALNGNGERITSEQLLPRNMGKGEERTFDLFQYVDDLTANALKTATFKVESVRKF